VEIDFVDVVSNDIVDFLGVDYGLMWTALLSSDVSCPWEFEPTAMEG
jgi:hypothetical protein